MDLNEGNDEMPVFSSATLDALQEFYTDRDAREKRLADLKSAATLVNDETKIESFSMEAFSENWNESQFWYSGETATTLARQLIANSGTETTLAVISTPSVFVQVKNLLASSKKAGTNMPKLYLLEFDERFNVFSEFIHYDFRDPLRLPSRMKGSIDHIICDPPFLSEECQTKVALTVRWLSRCRALHDPISRSSVNEGTRNPSSRLIVCTGERMKELVSRLYRLEGIATTTFMPEHARGLSNEFYCYANFECSDWKWRR